MKRLIKKAFRFFGYDIQKGAAANALDFLKVRQVDIVIDVGANIGQFGLYLRRWGYKEHIVSFEPIKSTCEVLKTAASRDGHWEVHNYALGARPGRMMLNVSENTIFSSFLELSDAAQRSYPETAVRRREEVEVVKLDDVVASFRGRNVFLKIDTQGFERQVLEGATKTMESLQGVQLELPVVHLYRDTWRIEEAIDYMRKAGFVIAQLRPLAYHSEDPVSLLVIDCIFRRHYGKTEISHCNLSIA